MSNKDDLENEPEYDAALDEVLKSLRGEYLNELPDRIDEMKDFVSKAKSDEAKLYEWLTEAHIIAHRLAGTAGSYGFTELSHAAGEMDQYLKNLLRNEADTGSVANRINWQTLDGLVEAVGNSVPPKTA